MEGINVAIVSGEITKIDKIINDVTHKMCRKITVRQFVYSRKSKNPDPSEPSYLHTDIFCYGCTAPIGSIVCIPCKVVGAKRLYKAKTYLQSTCISFLKTENPGDLTKLRSFAIITGKVYSFVEAEFSKNKEGHFVIIKSEDKFLKLWVNKKVKLLVGDYILAFCQVYGIFYLKEYTSMQNDLLLNAIDYLKNMLSGTTSTLEIYQE